MNKIKFLYELANTMRNKEVIKGSFQAEGKKDGKIIGNFENEFEKNIKTGYVKAKVKAAFECEGNKISNEFNIDAQLDDLHKKCMHKHPMRHGHHQGNHHMCCGLKGKLTHVTYLFGLLNSLKLDEKEDQSVQLTLNLQDLPEDMKQTLMTHCTRHLSAAEGDVPGMACEHHKIMKAFLITEAPEVELNIWVNKNREVEKLTILVEGQNKNEAGEAHVINLSVEAKLVN